MRRITLPPIFCIFDPRALFMTRNSKYARAIYPVIWMLAMVWLLSGCFVFKKGRNCDCPSWSENHLIKTDKLVSIEPEKD